MEDELSARSRSFVGTESNAPSEYSVSRNSNYSYVSRSKSTPIGSVIRGQETFAPRERFTLFKVEVNDGLRTWIVYRRYSDFVLLNKKLRRLFPGFVLTLPPKRLFRNNFDRFFLQRRQRGLEEFMKHLFSLPDVLIADPVKKFFRLDNPPGPDEDLTASRGYCSSLETSIASLKRDLQDQDYELVRLRGDLATMQLNGGSLIRKTDAQPSFTEKVLQQKLIAAEESAQQSRQDLERLRIDLSAEKALELSTRQTERQQRDLQLRDLMKKYAACQMEQDEAVKGVATALSSIGNVNISISGRSIDLKPVEGMAEKEEELKRAIDTSRQVMEEVHREHLEIYKKEIENLKSDLVRFEYKLQTTATDNQTLRDTLSKLHASRDEEIMGRDKIIYEYQKELADMKRYIENTEQKYFYSLLLGVKLNMALWGKATGIENMMRPQSLFDKIRDQGIAIENWPSWVSRELATLASVSRDAN